MIRILHVLGALNRGGAETMVMNLYRAIDRTKIQFDFIIHTTARCDYTDEIQNLGGKIYSIPKYTGKNHFQYIKAWNRFFAKHPEYKILHSHVRSTASLYLPIAKKYGLKTIIHSHSTSNGKGISSVVKKVLQYPLRFQADYFFACSKESGQWLFGNKVTEKKQFYILKNAINTSDYTYSEIARNKIRNEFHISPSAFVVGHIGRFIYAKNHSFLLDVFKVVHDKRPDAVLLLVGDGELKGQIQQKVKSLNLQKYVIFAGVRSDVPDLLSAMDCFVFPSNFEGLPVVTIEAQASGLHIICAETIPKKAKMTDLFEYKSLSETPESWASCVLQYATGYERKNTYNEIRSAGYDIHRTAKWLLNYYMNLASEIKCF